jgi:hypothetical protein
MRTPGWLRGFVLIVGLVGAAAAIRRLLMPALRFAPSLTELALRVERSEPGRQRGLGGVLASGLELGRVDEKGMAGQLAAGVVRRASGGLETIDPALLVDPARARRAAIVLGVAVIGVLGLAIARPVYVATGAARVLAPWAGVSWPKRTPVVDLTNDRVHALGSALELRAGVAAPAGRADRARVWASYRVRYGEDVSSVQIGDQLRVDGSSGADSTRRRTDRQSGRIRRVVMRPAPTAVTRRLSGGTDPARVAPRSSPCPRGAAAVRLRRCRCHR